MRRKTFTGPIAVALLLLGGALCINSCVHEPFVQPTTTTTTTPPTSANDTPAICFERDILPIFQSNCAKAGCHDATTHEDGYVFDTYDNIIKKDVVPGKASSSKVYKVLLETGDDQMPRNAPPLSAANIAIIKRWIDDGATSGGACSGGCDTSSFTYSGTIAPLIQSRCTGCHNSATAPGGNLMDHASVKNAAVNGNLIAVIEHTAGFTAMPQGGNKLSDCQITQVKKWVAAGALNN